MIMKFILSITRVNCLICRNFNFDHWNTYVPGKNGEQLFIPPHYPFPLYVLADIKLHCLVKHSEAARLLCVITKVCYTGVSVVMYMCNFPFI